MKQIKHYKNEKRSITLQPALESKMTPVLSDSDDIAAAKRKKIFIIIISAIAAAAVITAGVLLIHHYTSAGKDAHSDKKVTSATSAATAASSASAKQQAKADTEDPQSKQSESSSGTAVNATSLTSVSGRANGIDVSKWQGTIDWGKVKAAGIDFAMIRIGFRGENGTIYKDSYADYNIQSAVSAGVKVGVYFYSTAVSTDEAQQEASWVISQISGYSISYPVAFDSEGYHTSGSRTYSLSKSSRTAIARTFLSKISSSGYEPVLYSAVSGTKNAFSMSSLASFGVWIAQYPGSAYSDSSVCSYTGTFSMWQYTQQGTVDGISGTVDLDVSYFTRSTASPKDTSASTAAATTTSASASSQTFSSVSDSVTAKSVTNLRSSCSSKDSSNIVYQLKNGEYVNRTGIGDKGWSRLTYNGQTVYAITSYLTTAQSTTAAATVTETSSSVSMTFTDANDQVTAKSATNLRSSPSSKSNDNIVYQLKNGEYLTRTGINTAYGWSRLTYNGQTVYAVTSYLTT